MALFLRSHSFRGILPRELIASCAISLNSRPGERHFGVLNRPPPNYPGHIPLTRIEKVALAVGSAVGSLRNPYRGGMISIVHLVLVVEFRPFDGVLAN
jgi:ubiquinone biosynthesis protein COQ4